jgi:hypothetical protein
MQNPIKVIGTAANCLTVSVVNTIDKKVYIESEGPANCVAILGSLPIGFIGFYILV